MNCEQFERLIALNVEGDLPQPQQIKLTTHLTICGSCYRFAEEIRDSQSALRSYTGEDFDDALLAGIRRNVMSQIKDGAVTLTYWQQLAKWLGIRDLHRFAWAISGIAAVLALTATVMFYAVARSGANLDIAITAPTFQLPDSGVSSRQPDRQISMNRAPRVRHQLGLKKQRDLLNEGVDESASSTSISSFPSNMMNATTQIASGSGIDDSVPVPGKDVTRIEMQTANPNIRIIWFVEKKPNAPPTAVLSNGE
jgi:hypothetical protein